MFVVSYCLIFSFNRRLNFPKIIYRSFDQTPDELFSLSHFSDKHKPFMDTVAASQLRDAARDVIHGTKCTSLT